MPPTQGKFRPMKPSDGFRDYVLDQLAALPGVRARAMFGCVGIFAGDVFFAIIANDVLYLKVDDTNRAQFVDAGSDAFHPYPEKSSSMVMPYYSVPVAVLEDASALARWARQSIAVVARKKSAKTSKAKKVGTRAVKTRKRTPAR